MRILDAFCCQGGASAGYKLAGFEVVGVDLSPQPRYPFEFVRGDAIEFISAHGHEFDFIHASPPCQRYSATQRIQGNEHPDLIAPTRDAIRAAGIPGVIENVPDAEPELISPVVLCGAAFGLHTYRHRLFETVRWELSQPEHEPHTQKTVKMGRPIQPGDFYHAVGNFANVGYARVDMNVPWMSRDGVRECIPPAYSAYVGRKFIENV